MKNYLIVILVIAGAGLAFSFTYKNNGSPAGPTESYATVYWSEVTRRRVYIYYGSGKKEEIEFAREDIYLDKIVDTLNKMNGEGYELVSSSSHVSNQTHATFIEYSYVMRKKI